MVTRFTRQIVSLWFEDKGVSGTEYAVMLSMIVLIAFTGYFAMGEKIAAVLNRVASIG